MHTEIEAQPHRTPILRRAVAGLVVVAVAALALKLVIGFVIAIFWTVVAVAAVVAVIWALKTLIWQARRLAGAGYVVICLGFGLAGGLVGRMKGSSFWLWFLISGLVPFLGLLTAVCYRWEDRELRRRCPTCGRVVKLYDAKCMRCGEELEFPEVAVASEAGMRERSVQEPRQASVGARKCEVRQIKRVEGAPPAQYHRPVGLVLYLIFLFVIGLFVGALARLLLPGPDPMSIGMTALVGWCGTFSAGLFSWYVLHRHGGGLVLSVLFSMLVVWLYRRSHAGWRRGAPGGRGPLQQPSRKESSAQCEPSTP